MVESIKTVPLIKRHEEVAYHNAFLYEVCQNKVGNLERRRSDYGSMSSERGIIRNRDEYFNKTWLRLIN